MRQRLRPLGKAAVVLHAGWVRLRDKVFSVAVSPAFQAFGAHTVIQLPVRFDNEHRISIGHDVFVGSGTWLHVLPSEGREGQILIGDGTSIAGYCVFAAAAEIRIGNNVSICRNVYISDHTHQYEDWPVPIEKQGITDVSPVEIGDGAWLGENVVILPGSASVPGRLSAPTPL